MVILYFIGRVLYAAIFISSGYNHITKSKFLSGYAKSMGVPAAELLTVVSGIMILVGGILIISNFLLFYGALLIFLFLLPTTLMMHAFWKVKDATMKQTQQIMFMKNASMAGAALMIMCFANALH